ncbi:MAG TPA: acetylxylan esterase, partial [Candidatus Limnocylindria bacterium]|nr:acetylxylan esterase [Candidatus Limnocylindria bacterium]
MNSLSMRLSGGFILAVGLFASSNSRAASAFPEPERLPSRTEFPDPLVMLDGAKVTTAQQWTAKRAELKALFQHYMYGEIPPKPGKLDLASKVVDRNFLNGKATLKLATISIPGSDVPKIDLLLIIPNAAAKPAPVFLAMNFCGNHAIHSDPRIPLSRAWLGNGCKGCTNNHATDAARGTQASDWPLEQIIDRGYALATFANADVDSDRGDVSDGVYAWLAKERTGSATNSLTRDRGCIAGWAWGFQRCVDYLESDRDID